MSKLFSTSLRCRLPVLLFVFQGALLFIFVLFTTYDRHTDAARQPADVDPADNQLYVLFSLFQDIQLMLLVGLGLLLAFMKGYGVSAVAYNFLLSNFSVQWALIVQGFIYHYHDGKIHLGLYNLLTAEFATVTVLISAGAILGRTSPIQLLLMGFFEVPLYVACEWLIISYFQAVDIGGTVTVHVFSCYFGLGASLALYRSGLQTRHPKDTPSYISDLLSLVGAIFLWVFWPSFVSVLVHPGDAQHRAVLHTWITLSASVLTTFAISSLLEKKGKISMGHLQNATLAGGVAIGTVADMAIGPGGAFLLGILSSLVCILGFKYMTPFLANKVHLQDQCGIHNLHGLPGILGALAGIVAILIVPDEAYGHQLYHVFPARSPPLQNATVETTFIGERLGRSTSEQALFQAVGLGLSVVVSLVGGYLTGLLLKLPFLAQPPDQFCFDDELYFQIQKPLENVNVDQADGDLQMPLKSKA
ncbi:ammonium transporter Rh type A-like [Crotalus tigris]|uniref:ammonium transporter Rh type A-like n=1 Tax=Crotalus tigris TaxID=88082 RepID=UPI00192F79A6|nr:ammonium transporter Rh type A-like [Crotalus tigris]XP_039182881.1 ammonium transporter Rh type A-like [Crotalus tigris]XP_039182882.1 ammonium transporter Rh type A-like [Crotalus tigris]XP_039182883.1 ammonium transporter Rh type A-like [Crotalus tigris]